MKLASRFPFKPAPTEQERSTPMSPVRFINGSAIQDRVIVSALPITTRCPSATANLSFTNAPLTWNGYKYRCQVDSLYSSIFSLSILNPIDHGVTITVSDSVGCWGIPVTFTAKTSDTSSYIYYNWLVNGVWNGADSSGWTTPYIRNNDTVVAMQFATTPCGTLVSASKAIIMPVSQVPDSVTISASASGVCSGAPIMFTATPVNGGPTPTYIWLDFWQSKRRWHEFVRYLGGLHDNLSRARGAHNSGGSP